MMKRYRFNKEQQVECNRLVSKYYNDRYFLKDARAMARRDVENQIFSEELKTRGNK